MDGRRKMKKVFLAGLILVALVFSARYGFSQEKTPQPQLRKEIVKLNYLDASEVQQLLRPYFSREGQVSWSPDKMDLIVISDHAEIVEKILSIIKEIDIKPVDILFTVQLVLGAETGDGKSDEDLKNDPIIKELSNLLRYKVFTLLDTNFIRTVDRKSARLGLGKNADFHLDIYPRYAKQDKEEIVQIDVNLEGTSWVNPSPGAAQKETKNLIRTTLTLKSGDKTVVGVSKMDGGDKGLILIISGKVIK
jgi:hypothetical protein